MDTNQESGQKALDDRVRIIEKHGRPAFEVYERGGKVYRIWYSGRSEGFAEDAMIINGVAPMINAVAGWAAKAKEKGLISEEAYASLVQAGGITGDSI